MIDLSQNGYTHEEVVGLLSFPHGSRRESYRMDVLRGGVKVTEAEYTRCGISCDYNSQVKYSATMTLRENALIDWHTDLLRPVMLLEAEGAVFSFPFIPLKPMTVKRSFRNGMALRQVEAYDETVLLQDNSIGRRLYIPAGKLYTAAIEEILRDVGFDSIKLAASDAAFGADREDWERGDSVFDIVNQLLGEMNYRSLTVGADGALTSCKYEAPSAGLVEIVYKADAHSVVLLEQDTELDAFGRANVFIGAVNNSQMEEALEYTYRNDSPNSPTSTVRTGRVNTAVKAWDNVADYETLVDNVRRWAGQETAGYEISTLQTAIMPHHGVREVMAVETKGISGVYWESAWSIDELRAGGTMTHELRSVGYD